MRGSASNIIYSAQTHVGATTSSRLGACLYVGEFYSGLKYQALYYSPSLNAFNAASQYCFVR
jgi:hypothetical protein